MPSRASPPSATDAPVQPLAESALAPAGPGLRRLASDAVFAGAIEVLICHRGVDYRLRQTALGKLILTK